MGPGSLPGGAVNLHELEHLARVLLPRAAFDYIAGGAGDEETLAQNRRAFASLQLMPRVARGLADSDMRTTVLGTEISLPVLLAPTAVNRLAHPDGELGVARAAAHADTISVLSTLASQDLEEVAEAGGKRWFQLYFHRDRGVNRDLLARAEASGCLAICLTVDLQVLGVRDRDLRNRFVLPDGIGYANLGSGWDRSLGDHVAAALEPSLNWADVEWVAANSRLPLVVKGILRADDAELAVEHGARAVVVSNHGGRQLDGAVSSIEALPGVRDVLGGRCEVLLDGGIRRGADVIRALALGARAVLIGRPYLYALALAGQAGVESCLEHLRAETSVALQLCGCRDLSEVDQSLIRPVPSESGAGPNGPVG